MYQGHLPNGEGVQKHSAGDIYPVIIIHYGDGSARWVDQRRGVASPRQVQAGAAVRIHDAAQAYTEVRDHIAPSFRKLLAHNYREFLQEFVS